MLYLAALSVLTSAGLLYLLQNAYSQIERIQAASELARREQAEAAAKERSTLLAHVQAPEAAVFMDKPIGKQYADPENDDAVWDAIKQMEDLNGNG